VDPVLFRRRTDAGPDGNSGKKIFGCKHGSAAIHLKIFSQTRPNAGGQVQIDSRSSIYAPAPERLLVSTCAATRSTASSAAKANLREADRRKNSQVCDKITSELDRPPPSARRSAPVASAANWRCSPHRRLVRTPEIHLAISSWPRRCSRG